jgi:hypothetical protein
LNPAPNVEKQKSGINLSARIARGHGYIHTHREFSLSIPPHIKHETQQRISMEDIGLKDTNLNIMVYIDPQSDDFDW